MIHGLACWDDRIMENFDPELISDIIADANNVLWVDVVEPTEEDMAVLKKEFGFHPLALEDALRQEQRTKLDEYPGYRFIVLHSISYNKEEEEVRSWEIHLFIGANYLVTVHKDPIVTLLAARERWKQQSEMVREGIGFLVYALIDTIIDDYFPILDILDDRIDRVEEQLLRGAGKQDLTDLFTIKKSLLMMRRVTSPLRDIFNILVRRDQPLFSPQTLLYFQDVYDHLLRILDAIDLHREMITSLVETSLATQSNQLNQVMRTLTAMSIILMSISFIGSVYGMNFEHMPELKWPLGYWYALALMGGTAGGLWGFFRRHGWL